MSLEDIRDLAHSLSDRAANDPEFRARFLTDPLGTLTAAGLPAEIAAGFLNEGAGEAEVAGYMYDESDYGCNDTTCWSSGCPGTCNVSMCGTTR